MYNYDNDEMVQVKETGNQDLINGFNEIAKGESASTPSNDDSETEDPKLIGVFVL